jgi:hypothetical protein
VRREGVRRGTLDYPTASLIIVVGTETYLQPADSCLMTLNRALAPGQNYESGGRRFESFRARHFGIRYRRQMPPIVRPLRDVGGDDDEVGQANEAPIMTTERARSVAIGGDADSSRM